jgi:excisionase family DNA binding protein
MTKYTRKDQLRPQKRLYSLEDTSIYLGRSINAVRDMLHNGKMPFIRDGKRIFIDMRDLDLWIDRNKETMTF